MPLDAENVKSALSSQTVRASVGAIIVNVAVLIAYFTGKVIDPEAVKMVVDSAFSFAPMLLNIWLAWAAIKGRMKATQQIGGEYAAKLRNE